MLALAKLRRLEVVALEEVEDRASLAALRCEANKRPTILLVLMYSDEEAGKGYEKMGSKGQRSKASDCEQLLLWLAIGVPAPL